MDTTSPLHRPGSFPAVTVLLIDLDGRRCRDRLTALAKSGGVGEAQAAENVETWLARADRLEPDVVVMSADTFSEREIADSTVALERIRCSARLVLADVPREASEARRPLALSAWGQVEEGAPFIELLDCICRVASGQATLSAAQLGEVMRHLQADPSGAPVSGRCRPPFAPG
jgi:DNA-binding NarL/FixJ family response regulator